MIMRGTQRRRARGSRPAAAGISTGAPTGGAPSPSSVIPYDYAARFRLTGTPGDLHQDVINISPDGVFVGVGISYGFEAIRTTADIGRNFPANSPPPGAPAPPPPPPNTVVLPGRITLSQVPIDALIQGFRVTPTFDHLVFPQPGQAPGSPPAEPAFSSNAADGVPPDFSKNLFQKFTTQPPLSFLFNFVDTGTGRELQDEPMHNVASLGIANGDRPFRLLAKPVTFLPRSNLRLQVVEQSTGTQGTLFLVIFGYKLLGAGNITESEARNLARAASDRLQAEPRGPVIPFDYVTTFDLTGRPGNQISDEIAVNVEGGFQATAIGYGIATPETLVKLRDPVGEQPPLNQPVPVGSLRRLDLGAQPLEAFDPEVFREGVRLRPAFLRLAISSSGTLAPDLPEDLWDKVFERISQPEEVQFRYTIYDSARGRDLQNQPIHNVAGLGIADGTRPFRTLARPLRILPRSTLRVTVEERSGRGRLFIVFQGYKMLRTVR